MVTNFSTLEALEVEYNGRNCSTFRRLTDKPARRLLAHLLGQYDKEPIGHNGRGTQYRVTIGKHVLYIRPVYKTIVYQTRPVSPLAGYFA